MRFRKQLYNSYFVRHTHTKSMIIYDTSDILNQLNSAIQSQTALSACLKRKQLLSFAVKRRINLRQPFKHYIYNRNIKHRIYKLYMYHLIPDTRR